MTEYLTTLIDEQNERFVRLETEIRDIIQTQISLELHKQTESRDKRVTNTRETRMNVLDTRGEYFRPIDSIHFPFSRPGTAGLPNNSYMNVLGDCLAVTNCNGNVLFKLFEVKVGHYKYFLQFHSINTRDTNKGIDLIEDCVRHFTINYVTLCSKYNSFMLASNLHEIRQTVNRNIKALKYDYYEYSNGPYEKHINILCNCCTKNDVSFSIEDRVIKLAKGKFSILVSYMDDYNLMIRIRSETTATASAVPNKTLFDVLDTMLSVYNSFNNKIIDVMNRVSIYIPIKKPIEMAHTNACIDLTSRYIITTSRLDFKISDIENTFVSFIGENKYIRCFSNLIEVYNSCLKDILIT